ncbi:transporter substrate-binding domain-containing protein [Iodobacter sp. CM08]|uniref:substrate-binding periplasmic protein n=1 Tax=Iodobacter sp. CM08 TaxID=3085902 RepID=UPI002981767D|nr:transporter substrate-binding domain-containing protein [Iodobacter sp. CM08]MDW5417393.1 transporter substrate-binding domain-containing protein [Iodobacter sp. CM08]
MPMLLAICCLLLPLFCSAEATIQVGTGYSKPPYVISETQSGLELDIVRAALSAEQLQMNVVFLPPARALHMFKSGELDAITTVNEGSHLVGYWSDSHIFYQNYAITMASRAIVIKKMADLAGHSIAAFQNAKLALGPEYAAAITQASYQEIPNQLTQNKLLYTGRVEVVIGDRLIFEYLNHSLASRFNVQQKLQFSAIFPPTHYKVLFRNRDLRDRFNQGLATIHHNGVYHQIEQKYRSARLTH